MDVLYISDLIKIKIKMPSASQEPTMSSESLYEDLKEMDVLCPFEIKIWNMGISKTIGNIQIKMKMLNPSQ